MSSPGKPLYDDQTVVRYLLGAVPEEEASRLDELSIVDDDFAARLLAVENDLVDQYVRGELSDEHLDRFRAYYLSSQTRREKVRFAQSLQIWADRAPEVVRRRPWFFPALAFASATCLLVLGVVYLLYQNSQLKTQVARAQAERSLQARISEQQPSPPRSAPTPTAPPPTPAGLIALVLSPQTRGAGPLATIELSHDAEHVEFRLELESGGFTGYRVGLRDLSANRIAWQSGKLRSTSAGDRKMVAVSVPAGLLRPQNYLLELTSAPDRGRGELLSTYSFRVVR